MDHIIVKDLLVRGIIGVSDRERAQPQNILINITLHTDIHEAGESDDIHRSVNYRTVAKKIIAYVEHSARYTVEALATDIARLCLEERGVMRVCVRVEKPGAVRFAKSVGVEIEREQPQENKPIHQAYLSLGSNIEPVKNIYLAVDKLRQMVTVNAVSTIWETIAIGSEGPHFLNASVWVSTPLSASELKNLVISSIEKDLGRIRSKDKCAPRTIDIDILVFDEQIIDDALWQRDYLSIPTAELRPDLFEPVSGESLNQIAQTMKSKSTALPRTDLDIHINKQPHA